MAASSYKRLTGGTGDTLRSVSLSAGRPSGVKVCVCDNILGFFIAGAGASRLVDSLFPDIEVAPSFCCMFGSDPVLGPRANRSPGGGIPLIIKQFEHRWNTFKDKTI